MSPEFKEIELCDKEWVDPLLAFSDYRATEYCFTSLYMWASHYHTAIGRLDDLLLIRSLDGADARYVFPAGRGDVGPAIEWMEKDAERIGKRFCLDTLTTGGKDMLEKIFPGRYSYFPNRDSADYYYEAEKLISLSGKRYQSKRNFISRFRELPDWSCEPISCTDPDRCRIQLQECREMNAEWCRRNACGQSEMMSAENRAVELVLDAFVPLQLKGALLRLQGKAVAYTVGERQNSDTFIVHIEKAFSDIKGAYPMINQAFLKQEARGLTYVNREDDAGDEGLRKAKLSYHPVFLVEKYLAIRK